MDTATSSDSHIALRALAMSDLERTLAWHNSPTLYSKLGAPFRHVNREMEIEWLKSCCQFSQQEVNLAICLRSTGLHVGNIYLREIDHVSRRAVLHIFIGDPDQRSKGYGSSAIRLVLNHAFQDLNLEKISLEVLKENIDALRCYERFGFKREGCLRSHVYKAAQRHDMILMGLLRQEYNSVS
jgi:RimJ/RimL family protein N-acetyltransferase